MDSKTLQFCDDTKKKELLFPRGDLRKENESSMLGKFPFSQRFSTKYRSFVDNPRPGNSGLAQLSVRTEHTTTSTAEETLSEIHFLFIQSYYAGKVYSNYAGMKLVVTIWR